MNRQQIIILIFTLFLVACQPPIESEKTVHTPTFQDMDVEDTLILPIGHTPHIDGTLSLGEWDQALVEEFLDGSELFLLTSGEYLYIGINANHQEMIGANVFLQTDTGISISHVSAALGTGLFQEENQAWQRIKSFDWCCRNTSDNESSQAELAKFLEAENWVSVNSRRGTLNQIEYQIKLPPHDFRLAVVYIKTSPPYEKIPWPTNLDDDTIKPTPGGLPETMFFSPGDWTMISVSPKD